VATSSQFGLEHTCSKYARTALWIHRSKNNKGLEKQITQATHCPCKINIYGWSKITWEHALWKNVSRGKRTTILVAHEQYLSSMSKAQKSNTCFTLKLDVATKCSRFAQLLITHTQSQGSITIRHACTVPCTSARTRGARKAETSDKREEWTVESVDAWHKRKHGPSDKRVKGEGHVGCVRAVFLFTNGIQTLKCDNLLVKHPFVILFAPVRLL
jgi:hypothetical protein